MQISLTVASDNLDTVTYENVEKHQGRSSKIASDP
jgi:hypothetical protein